MADFCTRSRCSDVEGTGIEATKAGLLTESPPRLRARSPWWIYAVRQALAFAVLGGLLFLMFHMTSANLQSRGIQSGFAFLREPSRTPVTDAPIAVEAGVDSYATAFAAGALNSLKLTAASVVAATLVGLLIGLGRLSQNALARKLCAGYVEAMRNVPVLLHVFLWYGLILGLPTASEASSFGHFLLATNRGIYLAWFGLDAQGSWSLIRPVVDGFDVKGGIYMSPEFAALFIGISLYSAAFIAEIVRASVGSLPRGQWEATAALGLSRGTTLRRVVLPQALRVAMPPLTSEYLGIFKNSTLAVAIGYQDFMAISTTMLTDTGQAVEVMAIVMAFYATVSLLASAAMHAYGHRNMRWGL
jgi:general L-amino acid transport system permease protein